jgi:copper chaperone CopZ
MPPPPPAEPQPNPNIPVIKTREPSPTFSGTVRLQTFADLTIETGKDEKEKKDSGSSVDMAKVEGAVKRVKGVSSFSYDATKREIVVGFSGPVSDAKDIKIAIDTQGLTNEILSPAKVVVRPIGKIENPAAALAALKGVPGVVAAESEYNDLVAYADLSTASLDALVKAVEGSGVKCQISSHEEIKVKFGSSGSVEALKNDLGRTKWVLRVDVNAGDSSVKVLSVRGRITRSVVKSIMAKHGFPEAQ